ncbi:MAG: DNA polymerase I, partial [Tidjanibacter sp.]|nr:DNA polymerase I [Tidjanibacter sp.]
STYVEALPALVNPATGRIHTSYNQAVAATGRLSSTNPNLQNIPVRDDQGRRIREAFVASDSDHILLAADYSQVELRLMAHMSGDKAMIEAFRSGEDIHRDTASRLFHVAAPEVTPDQRRKAKTANFGIIYGISAFGLRQRMGNEMSMGEAKAIIDGYFASYPAVKEYIDRTIAEAKNNGFVQTIFGRKRYLPDINSANANVRSLAERNAINAPLQGSAADIIKIAMAEVARRLKAEGLRSKMILQVHDELIVDTLVSEKAKVEKILREAMEGAAQLAIPLVVDVGEGANWLEAH